MMDMATPTHQLNQPGKFHFKRIYWLYIGMTLPLVALLAFVVFQPIVVLPRISLAPGFTLTDQRGERLTNEDLRGSLVLYNFTYSHCTGDCRDTSVSMQAAQEWLKSSGIAENGVGGLPVKMVTVSFDPERDTPEVLQAYADGLGADPALWRFATGDPLRLKYMIGGGFYTYYDQRPDSTFEFDPAFMLVDGWGILRAEYRQPTLDLAIVERDLGLIVKEYEQSEGASRYAYEAAHLFLCYPR
jgi:protein SCO1/2